MPRKLNICPAPAVADVSRRVAQLAREAKLLEEGRDDLRAGRSISGAALDAWLEGLDGDQPMSVPGQPNR
jgi:hypothetical protein